jgi:MFS family permease
MKVFEPLKHRRLAFLWGGQVFSSVGDELFTIALVWVSASIVGNDTGYILALQAASVLVFSLFGGIWADHWDHRKTMVYVDVIRALFVMVIPLASALGFLGMPVLIVVCIAVSSLRAFFDPALRASLVRLSGDGELLHTTNALMETSVRLARVVGPGLIGLLSQAVPVIHYFTIDALTFLISAGSIEKIRKNLPEESHPRGSKGWFAIRDGLLGGYQLARKNRLIHFVLLTDAIANAAWMMIFPISIGLLIHQRMPDQVSALSLAVGAYGIGNLISNIIVGSIKPPRMDHLLFTGRIIGGIGFIFVIFAPTMNWMMAFSALAAVGGPMVDIAKISLIQKNFNPRETAKIYRFALLATHAGLLVMLLASPKLFELFSIPAVILVAAFVMVLMGVVGFVFQSRLFVKRVEPAG